jgi:hypothetical protein
MLDLTFPCYLPFSSFYQDPKTSIKFAFETMECYVSPTNIDAQNNVYWLDDAKENVVFVFNDNSPIDGPSSSPEKAGGSSYFDSKQKTPPPKKKEEEGGQESVFQTSGLLKKIIICDLSTFSYDFFILDDCELDFTLPLNLDTLVAPEKLRALVALTRDRSHLWNEEDRCTKLKIEIGNLRLYGLKCLGSFQTYS